MYIYVFLCFLENLSFIIMLASLNMNGYRCKINYLLYYYIKIIMGNLTNSHTWLECWLTWWSYYYIIVDQNTKLVKIVLKGVLLVDLLCYLYSLNLNVPDISFQQLSIYVKYCIKITPITVYTCTAAQHNIMIWQCGCLRVPGSREVRDR